MMVDYQNVPPSLSLATDELLIEDAAFVAKCLEKIDSGRPGHWRLTRSVLVFSPTFGKVFRADLSISEGDPEVRKRVICWARSDKDELEIASYFPGLNEDLPRI